MEIDDFCGSKFWDANITWHTNIPDFTPCVKETVFVWIPCAYLFLFTPLDVWDLYCSKYSNIPWSHMNVIRLLLSSFLIIISVVDLSNGIIKSNTTDAITSVLKIAAFTLTIVLQLLQKKHGIMTSGIQLLFWTIFAVLSVPQFLSHFRAINGIEIHSIIYFIYILSIFIQMLTYCFADKPPTSSAYENFNISTHLNVEMKSSFLKKITYGWFESFTWKGYRKELSVNDIHQLNPEYKTKEVTKELQKYWRKSAEKSRHNITELNENFLDDVGNNGSSGSILPAMINAFWTPLWFISLQKLSIELLIFTRPFLLGLLIKFTQSNDPLWHGLFYMAIMWFVSLLIALLNGQVFQNTYLIGFKTKAALMSSIYHKVLTMSHYAKKDVTVGQITNLMAIDAQRFMDMSANFHVLWSGPLVIGLAIYFLYQILGVAVLVGLTILIIMIPMNAYVASKIKRLQSRQMKKKDERIKLINEILNGIKVLKLYAWELSFEQFVLDVRNKEMEIIKSTIYYSTLNYITWTLAPYLVTLVSFTTYVLMDDHNQLNASTVFVSLTLFGIIKQPLTFFPIAIGNLIQSTVAIDRLNNFLNSENLASNGKVESDHEPSFKVLTKNSNHAIQIEKGTFSWDKLECSLKSIDFTVDRGQLVAIVGVIGSGKSTLISSILGETEKIGGSIDVNGSIAYVPQQPWIRNATIQENILFGKPLDQDLYDKVLDCCALIPDLDILPCGDQTEIGENGINLSGGQKLRISLARAVYRQSDIYLLDDPLSAVDAHVGKELFDKVIGTNGILAKRTRIFVTHSVTYLPQIERIFVMINGTICESGCYQDLVNGKSEFAKMVSQNAENECRNVESKSKDLASKQRNGGTDKIPKKKQLQGRKKQGQRAGKLIINEQLQIGSVKLAIYLRYFKCVGLLCGISTIFSSIAYQSLSVYGNIWLSLWTEDPRSNITNIRDLYLGIYGGIGILQVSALSILALSMAIGCLHASRTIHNNILRQMLRLPMSFFETNPLGRIVNRFSKDIHSVDAVIPLSIRLWITAVFTVLSVVFVITFSTPIFILMIIPITICYGFFQKVFVTTSRQLKRIISVTRSPIYSHFSETITGNSTIRAYKMEQQFIAEAEFRIDQNHKCTYASMIANRWLALRLEFIGSFAIVFAVLFAVLYRNSLSGSIVGLSISYALQITSVLNFLIRTTSEVETNIVAVERLEEYDQEKKEAEWITMEVDASWPSKGEIVFRDYEVKYSENLDMVLKGISFEIKPKEKIGIVGRTGSGKTSLMLGLFRILEAAGGSIEIDGIDISEIGLHTLRSRLSVIPQDPVLLYGSIRMNIDPLHVHSDDDIWKALEQANLKNFIEKNPKGLDYVVIESGGNLSVGQRQLICLTRALLKRTTILVMDEATAAVDLETDDLIQKTIRNKFQNCTVLTIAHRLDTIMDSDKILVLDEGHLMEYDTPNNLLEDTNSLFYKLAKDARIII